jgi:hypothetical protein
LAQTIRVFVQVLQRHGLGADVAARERVGIVALDRDDPAALHLEGQAADGLAQVAHAVARFHRAVIVGGRVGGGSVRHGGHEEVKVAVMLADCQGCCAPCSHLFNLLLWTISSCIER